MYCVVINKLKGIYMLRHIIYGINPKESMPSIKKNYYKNWRKNDKPCKICHRGNSG